MFSIWSCSKVYECGQDKILNPSNLVEASAGLDDNLLPLPSALIPGAHVHNSVGVNVEGDLNLRHAARCWWDSSQLELSQELVVLGHLSLTLVNLQLHLGLTIGGRGEHLRLLGRDCCVPVDQLGEYATKGLNSKGEGGDVKEQDIGDISSQNTTLNSSAHGHSLIRVDRLAGCTAKDFLAGVLHLGHPAHASDQNNFSDIGF